MSHTLYTLSQLTVTSGHRGLGYHSMTFPICIGVRDLLSPPTHHNRHNGHPTEDNRHRNTATHIFSNLGLWPLPRQNRPKTHFLSLRSSTQQHCAFISPRGARRSLRSGGAAGGDGPRVNRSFVQKVRVAKLSMHLWT